MLLTITYARFPATDLGYLLHKNPTNVQTFVLSFGKAHVFYPEASDHRCTAALLLDIDPIALSRGKKGEGSNRPLEHYVNDRPYVASSFLSVAIAQVFGSALTGRSRERQELADTALPFEVEISSVPCRGGKRLLVDLFEPLGYAVEASGGTLDEAFPEWGPSPYYDVRLAATLRLRDLLAHLYVLLPVLDGNKHYYVGEEEADKLARYGKGWMNQHPLHEHIARRYLLFKRGLVDQALTRCEREVEAPHEEAPDAEEQTLEKTVERQVGLAVLRRQAILDELRRAGVQTVVDFGCSEGYLLGKLIKDTSFKEIVGVDISCRALEIATRRLHLKRLPDAQRARLHLLQGSLSHKDRRLEGKEAFVLAEVIEHIDPEKLDRCAQALWGEIKPRLVIVTTPNREYNALFETLTASKLRHRDHRFEWTRSEFETWARQVANRFGYSLRLAEIGVADAQYGAPTQMAVFERSHLQSEVLVLSDRAVA